MRNFLQQHDLIYERAATEWIDGIPIANGAIGAMIWGDGKPLRFTLDSYDVWELRTVWGGDDPRFNYANLRRLLEEGKIDEMREVALRRRNMRFIDKPPPMPSRLAMGRLELDWKAKPVGFDARLDLHGAVATAEISFASGKAKVTSFVCSTRPILVIDIEGAAIPGAGVRLIPAPVDDFSRTNFDSWEYPDPTVKRGRDHCVLHREYSDNRQYSIVAKWTRTDNHMTLMVTIVDAARDQDTTAAALALLDEAHQLGVSKLRREHEAEWSGHWKRSAISLPDSRLENVYYVEQYKHHSSSRAGNIPITLQGLWTTDGAWPPWRGSYTIDMNVQQAYWPIFTSNTIDAGEPLFETYFGNLEATKRVGEYWYGKPIAVFTAEHGPGAEPFPGHFSDEHSPGAGAWIGHLFWLRWLYTRDVDFLRTRAYPFLREMVRVYLHIAEMRDDGKYHIPFTETPEYYDGEPETLGDDASYDIALCRFVLEALLEAQSHLAEPDPDVPRYRDLLDNLLDFPLDEQGGIALRPGVPMEHSHRHHSHVICLYPLDLHGAPADREMVDASFDRLVRLGMGEWSGWSYTWASMMAGRFGRTEMANNWLRMHVDHFMLPNTLHGNYDVRGAGVGVAGEPAITLEAGFCAAAAILELLLQSHGGLIRVFPTCLPTWADARFINLRAEGAFVVCAELIDHEVRCIDIESEVGQTCRVQNPFDGPCTLTDQATGKTRQLRGSVLKFATRRGGRYRLTPGKAPKSAITLPPPRRDAADRNWYGLKQHPRF